MTDHNTQTLPAEMSPEFAARYREAQTMCASTLLPKAFQNPADVMIAFEVAERTGLTPFAVCQNLAVINGRPSFFGDAIMAILQHAKRDGLLKSIRVPGEDDVGTTMSCRVVVTDSSGDEFVGYFDQPMAERANLWKKKGPWTEHPERMIQCRAIMKAARLAVPDRLTGIGFAEEQRDIERVVTVSARDVTAEEEGEPKSSSEVLTDALSAGRSRDEVEKAREALDQTLIQISAVTETSYAEACERLLGEGVTPDDLDPEHLAKACVAAEKTFGELMSDG